MSWIDVRAALTCLRADLDRYPGPAPQRLRLALGSQGFWAVAAYRIGCAVYALPGPLRPAAKIAWKPIAKAIEIATGVEIPVSARIGPGLYVGHFGCLVLSGEAVLGARCNLSQGVTIGVGARGGRRGVPVLGDRVYVGPGAKVFGPIAVGSDVAIGANAVVCDDVPSGVSVVGVPARVVSTKGSSGLIDIGGQQSANSGQLGAA